MPAISPPSSSLPPPTSVLSPLSSPSSLLSHHLPPSSLLLSPLLSSPLSPRPSSLTNATNIAERSSLKLEPLFGISLVAWQTVIRESVCFFLTFFQKKLGTGNWKVAFQHNFSLLFFQHSVWNKRFHIVTAITFSTDSAKKSQSD